MHRLAATELSAAASVVVEDYFLELVEKLEGALRHDPASAGSCLDLLLFAPEQIEESVCFSGK
jgi:hypothetical protein